MSGPRRDARIAALVAFCVALVVRGLVAAWGTGRFPPADDGVYFHTLALRVAEGHGYTWLWPDGVITPAAHYPVGYPALLAALYATIGDAPAAVMGTAALLGALGCAALSWALARATNARAGLVGGLALALHPTHALYTVAWMTEGVAASLVALATPLLVGRGRRKTAALVALGVWMGALTLLRPQFVLMAPVAGAIACRDGRWGKCLRGAALVLAIAVGTCAPWTVRNAVQMGAPALVSVNGGWNLLIGTQTVRGDYVPLQVPEACKEVWGEADKDRCFGVAAVRTIASDPWGFLARVPGKLTMTFAWAGVAAPYLHASNAAEWAAESTLRLGVAETVVSRLWLVACALGLIRTRARVAAVAGLAALAGAFLRDSGWIGWLALGVALCSFALRGNAPCAGGASSDVRSRAGGQHGPDDGPTRAIAFWTGALVLVTAGVHAAFFGAARYALPLVPAYVAATVLLWTADVRRRDVG